MVATISAARTADAGPPQVGITLSGLGTTQVAARIQSTWDSGATWRDVQSGTVVATGSAFVRDFFPPLNTPVTYRMLIDGVLTNLVSDPYGATAWSSLGWGTGGAGTYSNVYTYPPPSGIPTYGIPMPRKDWTAAASTLVGTGFQAKATSSALFAWSATYAGWIGSGWVINYATGRTFRARIAWYDAGSALLSYTDGATSASTVFPTWTSLTVTFPTTPPVGATQFALLFDAVSGANWASGDVLRATWAMIAPAGYVFPGYPVGSAATTVTAPPLTVASPVAWIQDPLAPRSAVSFSSSLRTDSVLLLAGSFGQIGRAQAIDSATPMLATLPVSAVGARQKPSGVPLLLGAVQSQNAAFLALRTLLDQAGPLVLRGLPTGVRIDPVAYVTAAEEDQPGEGVDDFNSLGLTCTQTRAPGTRIVVPWWTYDQVKALVLAQVGAGATYAQVKAAQPVGKTYTEWTANPGVV